MKKAALAAAAVAAVALIAATSAIAGWRWTRDVQYGTSTGTAHGKTCDSSKFSDWRWRGVVHSGGDTYRFRWIEPIRHDGRHRHLHYTSVSSTAWSDLPPSQQQALEQAVTAQLDKTRVGWYEQASGVEYLEYRIPGYGDQSVRWRPQHFPCHS